MIKYYILSAAISAASAMSALTPTQGNRVDTEETQELNAILHTVEKKSAYSYGVIAGVLALGMFAFLKVSKRVLGNVKVLIGRTNKMLNILEERPLITGSKSRVRVNRDDPIYENSYASYSSGLNLGQLSNFSDFVDGHFSPDHITTEYISTSGKSKKMSVPSAALSCSSDDYIANSDAETPQFYISNSELHSSNLNRSSVIDVPSVKSIMSLSSVTQVHPGELIPLNKD